MHILYISMYMYMLHVYYGVAASVHNYTAVSYNYIDLSITQCIVIEHLQ